MSLIDGLKNGGFSIDESIKKSYEEYIPEAKAKMPKPTGQFAAFLPKKLIPEMELSDVDILNAAKNDDAAVITIGKTSGEFGDRSIKTNFNLTDAEKKMISDVTRIFHKEGKKVVVILNVCGVIETQSWISQPDAVLISWLPGQEGGNSVADIISGKESPSGRLPMTWPLSYNDVPSKNDFPDPDEISDDELMNSLKGFTEQHTEGSRKNFDITTYNDGIYVGYRYYTTKNIPVSFPFGYGMSFTSFEYGKPNVEKDGNGNIKVSVNVRNNGKMAGKEVVQVYVSAPGKDMNKPARELKGFAKTKRLAIGESETVTINIPFESLASFNDQSNCWQVESGIYKVMVAKNAADLKPMTTTVYEEGKITENVRPCLVTEQK